MSAEMEVDDTASEPQIVTDPVEKVFKTTHVLLKIIEFSKEQKRDELFIVGTRTRQGNLRSFIDLRLVDKTFNEIVSLAVRREFRRIRIDIDDYFISCNHFMIEKHRVPPNVRRRPMPRAGRDIDPFMERLRLALNDRPPLPPRNVPQIQPVPVHPRQPNDDSDESILDDLEDNDDLDDDDDDLPEEHVDDEEDDVAMDDVDNRSDSDSESDSDQDMEDEQDDLSSEDIVDVRFIERFLKWLADTFNPTVECFKVYDSWSFKPCSVPDTWMNLQRFRSFHPDMKHCSCERCVSIVRSCHTFGPISYRMIKDALKNRDQTFKALSCTDSFLADIAIDYTSSHDNRHSFDAARFEKDYKGIKVNELLLAVQAIPDIHTDSPSPHPLEVIQMLIKLWEIKTIHFELVKVMENDYYVNRRAWETSGAYHLAHLITYRPDSFDDYRHVVTYREAGTLDAFAQEEVVPIFDLRIDLADQTRRMSSSLSLLSLASQENVADTGYPLDWPFQGRIVFNMFKSNHIAFVHSSNPEFQGVVGMVNWLKYTVRGMMRWTWGGRSQKLNESNKNVYWIFFIEDGMCIRDLWFTHMEALFVANFPRLEVTIDKGELFKKCPNRRILNYDCITRPDVLERPRQSYYVTFYDRFRNNRTYIKFIKVCI